MMTISALAKSSGLSRSTLLYYDRMNLLRPIRRSRAGYRLYSFAERDRLEQICLYRQIGIPLKDIERLLDKSAGNASAKILQHQFRVLGREIGNLRKQQHQIMELLKQGQLQQGVEMINKERWVEIMRSAGLDEQDMRNWHIQFEKMEPVAHQEFLESLGIKAAEISLIREWSRSTAASK
jgi:MerR family transcriptional regulator, thiopeptide resistance regulator